MAALYQDPNKTLKDAQIAMQETQAARNAAIAAPSDVAPSNFEEKDDSVATALTGLMSSDNPLMRQAQTAGLQQANRRGLLNSSIAVGAAQNEAYKVALPIAQQEAQQAASYNALSREIGSREKMQIADQAAQKQRLGIELTSREVTALGEMAAAKERLGMQLTSQEKLAANQLAGQIAMQEAQIASSNWQASAQIKASAQQTLVQSNTSAYNVYQSALDGIRNNTSMSADAKRAAITAATNHYNATLTRNQKLYQTTISSMP